MIIIKFYTTFYFLKESRSKIIIFKHLNVRILFLSNLSGSTPIYNLTTKNLTKYHFFLNEPEVKKKGHQNVPFLCKVLEAGLEPARSVERYPLKIVCLPNSTTPAFIVPYHRLPVALSVRQVHLLPAG
jgi:hypothetical protein